MFRDVDSPWPTVLKFDVFCCCQRCFSGHECNVMKMLMKAPMIFRIHIPMIFGIHILPILLMKLLSYSNDIHIQRCEYVSEHDIRMSHIAGTHTHALYM